MRIHVREHTAQFRPQVFRCSPRQTTQILRAPTRVPLLLDLPFQGAVRRLVGQDSHISKISDDYEQQFVASTVKSLLLRRSRSLAHGRRVLRDRNLRTSRTSAETRDAPVLGRRDRGQF